MNASTSKLGNKKIINGQAREIVNNLLRFMKKEASVGIVIPLRSVYSRATAATGVSKRTMMRIYKEGRAIAEGKISSFSTPREFRTKKFTKSAVDDLDVEFIRRIIHNFNAVEKKEPTLRALLPIVKENTHFKGGKSSLRELLNRIGFKWNKTTQKWQFLPSDSTRNSVGESTTQTANPPHCRILLCRLCLAELDSCNNIYKSNKLHGFIIADVINDLLGLDVHPGDGFPERICSDCLDKVAHFKHFKRVCYKSKNKLRDIISQNNYNVVCLKKEDENNLSEESENEISVHPIKCEVEDEFNESDGLENAEDPMCSGSDSSCSNINQNFMDITQHCDEDIGDESCNLDDSDPLAGTDENGAASVQDQHLNSGNGQYKTGLVAVHIYPVTGSTINPENIVLKKQDIGTVNVAENFKKPINLVLIHKNLIKHEEEMDHIPIVEEQMSNVTDDSKAGYVICTSKNEFKEEVYGNLTTKDSVCSSMDENSFTCKECGKSYELRNERETHSRHCHEIVRLSCPQKSPLYVKVT